MATMLRSCTVALLLLIAPPARALGFDEALRLTPQSPRMQGLKTALEVRMQLDAQVPNQTGNPELTVAPGIGLGASPGLAFQLGVQQSWNLADLARARRQAAGGEREALAVELRMQALEQRLATAQAWLVLWTAQAVLDAARRELDLALQLQTALDKATLRGGMTSADAAEARLYASEAELRVVAAEGDVHDQAVVLARALSLTPTPLPMATGPLPTPTLPDENAWQAMVLRAARLPEARWQRLRALAERARAVEIASMHGSTLALGAAMQRDGQGTTAILGTFALKWNTLDRGQRAASQAAETVARIEAEATHAGIDAAHRMAAAWHEVEHNREREKVLRDKVLAAAEQLTAVRERQFHLGAATVFEVLRARQSRLDAQRRQIEATGTRTWAELKAWQLAAAIVDEGGEP
jgi:cobalt-zinc-cadmium efflux system outer membrane protein